MKIKVLPSLLLGLLFGAFCFGAGLSTAKFAQNSCYSEALSELGLGAQKVAVSENHEAFEEWASFANKLPLRGYESDCQEILSYVRTGEPGD